MPDAFCIVVDDEWYVSGKLLGGSPVVSENKCEALTFKTYAAAEAEAMKIPGAQVYSMNAA